MNTKIKLSKNDWLAFIYVLLVQTIYLLQGTIIYRDFLAILLGVAIAVGVMYTIRKKVRLEKNGRRLLALFILLVLTSFYVNRDTRLLVSISAIFVGMFVKEEKTIRWLIAVRLVILFFAIASGGYMHINTLALHGGITLMLIILNAKKKKYFWLYIVLYCVLSVVTKSGSMIICVGITLVLSLFVQKKSVQCFLTSKAVKYSFPLLLNILLLSTLFLDGRLLSKIGINILPPTIFSKLIKIVDSFISSRITLSQFSLMRFGISLWGNNIDYSLIDTSLGNYFNLDSGLMWLLQQWGIVMTVVYMALMTYYVSYSQKQKKYQFLILTISIALWSINEDILLSAGSNVLFFFVGRALKKERKVAISDYS